MNEHPSTEQLRRYFGSDLLSSEFEQISAHTNSCSECNERLKNIIDALPPLAPDVHPIPGEDYVLIKPLGEGGFGVVWKARGPGGLLVALKFIHEKKAVELRALEEICDIGAHPNLLIPHGKWKRGSALILATELCDESLNDRLNYWQENKLPGIPPHELLGYIRDAARGIDVLNERGIQHRDIKPSNLLLQNGGVKVADLGLAKKLAKSIGMHSGNMTREYAPPEAFRGAFTRQSDQFSLAVTYLHLRTGNLPAVGKANEYLTMEGNLSEKEKRVLSRALANEPEDRWPDCSTFVNALALAGSDSTEDKRLGQRDYHEFPPLPALLNLSSLALILLAISCCGLICAATYVPFALFCRDTRMEYHPLVYMAACALVISIDAYVIIRFCDDIANECVTELIRVERQASNDRAKNVNIYVLLAVHWLFVILAVTAIGFIVGYQMLDSSETYLGRFASGFIATTIVFVASHVLARVSDGVRTWSVPSSDTALRSSLTGVGGGLICVVAPSSLESNLALVLSFATVSVAVFRLLEQFYLRVLRENANTWMWSFIVGLIASPLGAWIGGLGGILVTVLSLIGLVFLVNVVSSNRKSTAKG